MMGKGRGGGVGTAEGGRESLPFTVQFESPLTLPFLDFMYIGIELTEASLQDVSVL